MTSPFDKHRDALEVHETMMGPARGRLLRYEQAVDADRTCCVSFASLAYEAPADA